MALTPKQSGLTAEECASISVELQEFQKTGPKGDRYQGPGVPYADYKVVMTVGGQEPLVVREFEGFDHMWTAPKPLEPLREEAEKFAKAFAANLKTELKHRRFKAKIIQQTVWEEQ